MASRKHVARAAVASIMGVILASQCCASQMTVQGISGRDLTNTKWSNQLGSTMLIDGYNPTTGVFSGLYNSAVGKATRWYIMVGRANTEGNTVGWTVVFKNQYLNAHSTATWSGQFQTDKSGNDVILTTWLLTTQTTPPDNWRSTRVGFDYFTNLIPNITDI